MPVISAKAMITYSHLSITSRSTPVVLISTKASSEPRISSHTPSTQRWTTNHQYQRDAGLAALQHGHGDVVEEAQGHDHDAQLGGQRLLEELASHRLQQVIARQLGE